MTVPSIIDLVLECVECVSRLSDGGVKRSFRARARQVPSDMYTMGFAYALTMLAARSGARSIELGLSIDSCSDLVNNVMQLNMDSTKKGYALYTAILVYVLKKSGLINATRFSELVKISMNNPALDTHSVNVALWLKRFTEAYIYEG